MNFGRNAVTGVDRYLTLWKSNDDPARGDFTPRVDPNRFPQLVLRKGSVVQFRTGPWNGLKFCYPFFDTAFVFNEKEMYYLYKFRNTSPSKVCIDS